MMNLGNLGMQWGTPPTAHANFAQGNLFRNRAQARYPKTQGRASGTASETFESMLQNLLDDDE